MARRRADGQQVEDQHGDRDSEHAVAERLRPAGAHRLPGVTSAAAPPPAAPPPAAPVTATPAVPATPAAPVTPTERASSWATSTTSSDSGASPEPFLALTASPSMTRQYGQPVEIVSGLVDRASSMRSVLIRLPIRSSIHIRAPPAPQQNPRSLHLCISSARMPGTRSMISRGGVYTLLCRPRKHGS